MFLTLNVLAKLYPKVCKQLQFVTVALYLHAWPLFTRDPVAHLLPKTTKGLILTLYYVSIQHLIYFTAVSKLGYNLSCSGSILVETAQCSDTSDYITFPELKMYKSAKEEFRFLEPPNETKTGLILRNKE